MKKVIMWVLKFIYKYSGLQALVSSVETFVLNYRLRLRFVPVSYKLFLVLLGVSLGSGWMTAVSMYKNAVSEPWRFEQPLHIETVKAATVAPEAPKEKTIEELADYIWLKESTRGKNNYSKCEAVGKINGIGYGIPGDGSYMCFDSHEDEMTALHGWLVAKKALGWSELKMLCTYSGNHYAECKK